MKYAWVIETANNEYWNGKSLDRGSFVADHSAAIRFSRFEDAEIVKYWLLEKMAFALRSSQHGWVEPGDMGIAQNPPSPSRSEGPQPPPQTSGEEGGT